MTNPWHQITAESYEKHMAHDAVRQMHITGEQLQLVTDGQV